MLKMWDYANINYWSICIFYAANESFVLIERKVSDHAIECHNENSMSAIDNQRPVTGAFFHKLTLVITIPSDPSPNTSIISDQSLAFSFTS